MSGDDLHETVELYVSEYKTQAQDMPLYALKDFAHWLLSRERWRIKAAVSESMPPEGMWWSDWFMEVVDGER